MKPYIQPDFYIIGAPKSGTTSLREYLLKYPRVYIPSPEEPNFFCADINPVVFNNGIDWYTSRYYNIDASDFELVGEKSSWYLYSKEAIKNILSFNPNAKIIVMLRNPLLLAYAFHHEMVFCRMEKIRDFETAWTIQDVRYNSSNLKNRHIEKLFHYGRVASLGSQLEKLIYQVPSEQLFIGFLDDLKSKPNELMSNLCKFLSIPYNQDIKITKENASKIVKWKLLDNFLAPPRIIYDQIEILKDFIGIKSLYLGKLMRYLRLKYNTKIVKRDGLNQHFKNKLLVYFEAEICKLESITNRDLSHYLSI